MKLLPLVGNIIAEGLNLPKKKPIIYSYQKRCYPNGDPHNGSEIYNDEECYWAKSLHDNLDNITDHIPDKFQIIDIFLFDKYQGPYADVNINDKIYEIWTSNDESESKLFIKNYPIDNTSADGIIPGFQGTWEEIADMIESLKRYQQN